MKLLSEVYPNHNWNKEKFLGRQKKSSQWRLFKTLQEILPGVDILEEYQLPDIFLAQTGNVMFYDIYVPSFNIIFEYHGYQHYYDHYLFGDVKSRKGRDNEKKISLFSKQHHVL